ncbi:MAG: ANTAR domain-containing protein, partial [Clostridia bacterium]|nr:ANTAR domain-containing protein [Clostridia bacterium]
GMSEEQAHRYIETAAMDMRVSKKQIAEKIISIKQYD